MSSTRCGGMRRAFRQSLQQFILTDVTPLGNTLGTGSYGSVEEVKYNHIVCAGKKLHEALIEVGSGATQKYLQECQLMSSLRHPNVTLFLGICFLPSSELPLLVMERLDTNLDDLLESMSNLPLSLKCSVLDDTASGLLYLHERQPPVIHRDLTARNVLLTSSLVAKITDLGNSRIIDFKMARTLSKLPGTFVYMPPEALDDKNHYGPSLDIFSFGHLALFTIIQKFPCNLLPSTYPNPVNVEEVQGRTEIERRMEYMKLLESEIGQPHPSLIQLVKQCLHNVPQKRPTTEELLTRLQKMRVEVGGERQSSLAKLEVMRKRLPKLEVKIEDTEEVDGEYTDVDFPPKVPPRLPRSPQPPRPPRHRPKVLPKPAHTHSWYCDVNRMKAFEMLQGKPNGTFLCRPTKDPHVLENGILHTHTVDLMYNGVRHIKVLKKDSQFGFSLPPTFATLAELVLHFSTNSLEVHSGKLTTTLKYPISTLL